MFQQSLNNSWNFQAPDESWLSAEVPGCIHTDLLRHNLIPDPFYGRNEFDLQWIEERDWNYKLSFVPASELLQHEVIELVCEGLDTVATIRLNGEVLLQSENMFHRHRLPVMGRLRDGENTLEISFGSALDYIRTHRTDFTPPREFNDPVGNCVRIRKQQCQFGWDWGPRFVTVGVWRPIFLEGWSANRLQSVRIEQQHDDANVTLKITPQLARADENAQFRVTVSLGSEVVAATQNSGKELQCNIANPQLWWPSGQGEQPLYEINVELLDGGGVLSSWQRRIGLRTIELDMGEDEFEVVNREGRKLNRFGLRVNGRLIFAKGANWIPAHSFVAGLAREDYEPSLRAARDANMNIMRLWGGGIYEHEAFYDVCDELGLLVWHDFMFACTLYPSDKEFLDSVHREAVDQIERIRHRACLAIWCGNNELVALNRDDLGKSDELRAGYMKLFLETIPGALQEADPVTAYIHTSPLHTIPGAPETAAPSHDEHDWNVWHNLAPVEYYETTNHRFNSEFGMQSYPSPQVAATFCPPEEPNILSPTFEAHQKHGGGNSIIANYTAQLFRLPRDYAAQSYLSQINQAYCMKTAIEHFRRQQPQCLGAMYWQLNDCWPVASWSSLEFGGNWKALQHYARRFFAPALVSVKMHGEDKAGIGNRRINTRGAVDLWTSYDAPQSRRAVLSWQLATLDGKAVTTGEKEVALDYGQSILQQSLDFTDELERTGKNNAYLRVILKDAESDEILSCNTALFTAPRFLELSREPIRIEQKLVAPGELEIMLSTPAFHYGVFIEQVEGAQLSDNFFDLFPGETRTVTMRFDQSGDAPQLHVSSLVDSY